MGYLKTAAIGVGWVAGFRLSVKFLGFIRTAVLARILLPAQFGLYGIATLILGLLEMITETGINVVLVQHDDNNTFQKKINTAYIISIARGILLGLSLIVASSLIATFFHKPEAAPIIRLIGVVPLLRGFINPAIVTLQKNLLFKKEFFIRLSITLVDAVTAISLSLIFHTPLALVAGMIAGVLVEIVCSFVFIPIKPKFHFSRAEFTDISHHGKWVTVAGILNYLATQGPNYVLGKYFSSTDLGLYNLAYNTSTTPVNEINEAMNRVNFPLYIKIKGTRERLLKAFLKHHLATFLLVTPISLIMIFFAQPIVLIIAGDSWLGAVPTIQLLSVYSILINLGSASYPLFLALKKQQYLALITLIQLISFVVAVLYFSPRFGPTGVVYSLIACSLAILPPKFFLVAKVLLKPETAPHMTAKSVTT